MRNVNRGSLLAVLLFAASALPGQIPTGGMGAAGAAGMGGAAGQGGTAGHGFHNSRPGIVGGFQRHHQRVRGNPFFNPFWTTAFWWGDGYPNESEQVIVQPASNPVVVQAPAAPAGQEVKPANPLLIELQGGRFVRLTDSEASAPVSSASATQPDNVRQQAELPPAVLVFRDGRRQEVSSYSIIGPALYASGSYWTNGYWTQKILLADLDLPATRRANQERGVNFVLPSSPDQVVTRP